LDKVLCWQDFIFNPNKTAIFYGLQEALQSWRTMRKASIRTGFGGKGTYIAPAVEGATAKGVPALRQGTLQQQVSSKEYEVHQQVQLKQT
jgi:hypothetical protein